MCDELNRQQILFVFCTTYQWHRLRLGKLDVAQAFEATGLVAGDQPHVADFANCREELLQIPRADTLGQLHAKYGTGVPLFRRHLRQNFLNGGR